MTRTLIRIGVVAATALTLSFATASVASAGVVFTAPANDSFLQSAPTIEWTTEGFISAAPNCTLELDNSLAAATNPCNGSPYFAAVDPTDTANILWDLNIANLATVDGFYELTVEANFAGGPESATFRFTIDTVDPVVTIDPLTSPTNNNTPSLEFSLTEANPETLECAFDASGVQPDLVTGYTSCSSPVTASTPLADGGRALYIRASDGAGNIEYEVESFVVDTVLPVITITSPQPNQVFQSSVPELGIAAADPGSGVTSLLCKYDAEPFVACNDAGFLAKSLGNGAHTLTVQATDAATNVATSVIPFSVNAGIDTPPTPTDPVVPGGFKAKKLSGKVKGSKYRLNIQGSFAVPAGADPSIACKGTVQFSITGKLKGKKAKTFRKSVALKPAGQTCSYSANFSIPKAYKGKRLVARTVFNGNALLAPFSKTAVIRRA